MDELDGLRCAGMEDRETQRDQARLTAHKQAHSRTDGARKKEKQRHTGELEEHDLSNMKDYLFTHLYRALESSLG